MSVGSYGQKWNFGNGRLNLHITQNAQGYQGGITQKNRVSRVDYMGIPREWESLAKIEINLHGNGNDTYFHGNMFQSWFQRIQATVLILWRISGH